MGNLVKDNKCFVKGMLSGEVNEMIDEKIKELFKKVITVNGGIEVYGSVPYIDFHQDNSSKDWTHRMIGLENEELAFCLKKLCLRENFGTSSGDNFFFSAHRTQGCTVFGAIAGGIAVRDIFDENTARAISASEFNRFSSRRYKKNIEEMTEEEASKVDDINVYVFDYINEKNGVNQSGVIAEEAYKVLPSIVTLAEVDGEMVPDSVDYSKIVPYLLKRDQMKEKRINSLEKTVEELLVRVECLEGKE